MKEFSISDSGYLHETDAHEVATRAAETFPWVDPLALEASVMLIRASQTHARVHAPTQAEFGLSGARFGVLRVLFQTDGAGLTMNQIASRLQVTAANITKLIEGLVDDGLAERTPDPDDRRAVRVRLTDAGRERFEAVRPLRFRRIQQEFAGLDETEKKILIHLLAKLRMTVSAKPPVGEVVERFPTHRGRGARSEVTRTGTNKGDD